MSPSKKTSGILIALQSHPWEGKSFQTVRLYLISHGAILVSSTHQELKPWPVLCAFWISHKLYGFSSHDLTFLFHFHLNDVCLIFWTWIYLYRFLPLVWSIIVICLEQGELSKLELSEPSGLKVVPIYSVFSLVSIKSQSARSCIAVYPLIASWGLRTSHSFLRTSEISPILYF